MYAKMMFAEAELESCLASTARSNWLKAKVRAVCVHPLSGALRF
jgi:muconolactone delta-isomerase